MGQKVNPISVRLNVNRSSDSQWFHHTKYAELLGKDMSMRHYLQSLFRSSKIFFGRCVVGMSSKKINIIPYLYYEFQKHKQKKEKMFFAASKTLKNTSSGKSFQQKKQTFIQSERHLTFQSTHSASDKNKKFSLVQRFQKEFFYSKKILNLLLPHGVLEYSRFKSHFFVRYALLLYSAYLKAGKKLHHSLFALEMYRFLWKFIVMSKPSLFFLSKKSAIQQRIVQTKAKKHFQSHVHYTPFSVDHMTSSASFLNAFIVEKLEEKRKEKKRGFNAIMKQVEKNVKLNQSIDGVRIVCSGRINGVEMAEVKSFKVGKSSLNVFSNHIDYSFQTAHTGFGLIGVKVWISFKK